jgi:hypothetical protein
MKAARNGTLKMFDLADRLKIEHHAAIGLMETFWKWTCNYAPDGDSAAVARGGVTLDFVCSGLGPPAHRDVL